VNVAQMVERLLSMGEVQGLRPLNFVTFYILFIQKIGTNWEIEGFRNIEFRNLELKGNQ
jgi:hypothetical protein